MLDFLSKLYYNNYSKWKENNSMDLIKQLESLRISDSSFFGVGYETQCAYERANDMLNECLEVVWKWLKERNIEE